MLADSLHYGQHSKWRVHPTIAATLLAPAFGAGTVLLTFYHHLPLSPNEEIYVGMVGMLLAVIVGLVVIGYWWKIPKTRWVWIVLATHTVSILIGTLFLAVFMLALFGYVDAAGL